MKYLNIGMVSLLASSTVFALNQNVKVQSVAKDKLCAKSAGIALGNKLDFWGEPAGTTIYVKEIDASEIYEVTTSTEGEDHLVYQIKVSNMRSEDGTCTATHFRTSASGAWEAL